MKSISTEQVHNCETSGDLDDLRSDHKHKHSQEHIKRVANRLARASGHLESVKRMVEDGRDCSEVLVQLSAVISALNNTGKVILKEHIDHCIVDAVKLGDEAAIENLTKAIDHFIKPSN